MNNTEIWKEAEGMIGLYEISNLGRLRNTKTKNVLVLADNGRGYMNFRICNQTICKTFRIHRVVMLTFSPIDNPEDYTVHHKDFNPGNNELSNLEWISMKDNLMLSRSQGRFDEANKGHSKRMKALSESGENWLINRNLSLKGEDRPGAKLKDSEVLEIRKRRSMGETCISLGKEFNVSHRTISAICNYKIRKD